MAGPTSDGADVEGGTCRCADKFNDDVEDDNVENIDDVDAAKPDEDEPEIDSKSRRMEDILKGFEIKPFPPAAIAFIS